MARDSFGSPGGDALASAREAMRVRAERAAAAEQARAEAEIRSALTARVKAALIATVDNDLDFGEASGHIGDSGFDALAEAAVGALAEFYAEGTSAIWERART